MAAFIDAEDRCRSRPSHRRAHPHRARLRQGQPDLEHTLGRPFPAPRGNHYASGFDTCSGNSRAVPAMSMRSRVQLEAAAYGVADE